MCINAKDSFKRVLKNFKDPVPPLLLLSDYVFETGSKNNLILKPRPTKWYQSGFDAFYTYHDLWALLHN